MTIIMDYHISEFIFFFQKETIHTLLNMFATYIPIVLFAMVYTHTHFELSSLYHKMFTCVNEQVHPPALSSRIWLHILSNFLQCLYTSVFVYITVLVYKFKDVHQIGLFLLQLLPCWVWPSFCNLCCKQCILISNSTSIQTLHSVSFRMCRSYWKLNWQMF
jgi:hypothetical protein